VEELGDFTTTLRVLPISGLAIVIGAVCAVLALLLLRLKGLFTNLFYFARWSTTMVFHHLGTYAVLPPVMGALVKRMRHARVDLALHVFATRRFKGAPPVVATLRVWSRRIPAFLFLFLENLRSNCRHRLCRCCGASL
jgi:hypothetical protein